MIVLRIRISIVIGSVSQSVLMFISDDRSDRDRGIVSGSAVKPKWALYLCGASSDGFRSSSNGS